MSSPIALFALPDWEVFPISDESKPPLPILLILLTVRPPATSSVASLDPPRHSCVNQDLYHRSIASPPGMVAISPSANGTAVGRRDYTTLSRPDHLKRHAYSHPIGCPPADDR